MNIPNKITLCRIILSILLLVLMIFPVDKIGIVFPEFNIGSVLVDSKYIICAVIFIVAALTDFLDGHLARKYNLVTDLGKVMDAIADKLLVNGVLIVLAVNGWISVVIPVVIISRDIAASFAGKAKTACMLVGVSLLMIYDLPFALIGFYPAKAIIMIATVLSVISGIQYYYKNKKYLFDNK